jgi:hypothetical protein
MSLQNAFITNSTPAAIYTSSGNNVISTVHICNNTANTVYANVYMVPSGFTANALTIVYGNLSISAYNTYITQEKFALGNGDAVYANVNVSSGVTSTISYIGI